MPDIRMRLGKDVLVCEGAMGTMLQKLGMPLSACADHLNLIEPEMVQNVHRYYHIAGANCAITNTFGATKARLSSYGSGFEDIADEINVAGVEIARSVNPEHILADVGPCTLMMPPFGNATFDQVFMEYYHQVASLASAKPDAILIETMIDIADARAAVIAAKEACDLPVFVTCSFNPEGRLQLSGTDPEAAAVILEAAGADALGINCGEGPEQVYPLIVRMSKATSLPLIVQPNAGLPITKPDGSVIYPGTPDEMAQWARRFRDAGVQFIGSCCGSTPAYTGAIAVEVGGTDVVPRTVQTGGVTIAGPRGALRIGGGAPVRIIAPAVDPAKDFDLLRAMDASEFDDACCMAIDATLSGADIVDVRAYAPGLNEDKALPAALLAIAGLCSQPLAIGAGSRRALAAGLKAYPGRALISASEAGVFSSRNVFHEAQRYGAAIIVRVTDNYGGPQDKQGGGGAIGRAQLVGDIAGLPESSLIAGISLGEKPASPQDAAQMALEAIKAASGMGFPTVVSLADATGMLGEDNVAAFLSEAVDAGLSAIVGDPSDPVLAAVRTARDGSGCGGGMHA